MKKKSSKQATVKSGKPFKKSTKRSSVSVSEEPFRKKKSAKKSTKKTTKRSTTAPPRPNRQHLFSASSSVVGSSPDSVSNSQKTKQSGQKTQQKSTQPISHEGHRLQKVLAAAGFGSRRECEELITTGRVEIDRKTVTEFGVRVSPMTQEIRVDGVALKRVKPVYFAVNKPKGYVCTNWDPERRPRAIDLVPEKMGRLFSIGRLDLESEGLLLMTNDGALAERLTHPKYEVPKCYRVLVAGLVDFTIVPKLEKGVHFAEGHAKASNVKVKGTHKNSSILEIELTEGKNREIRRLLARLGHKVMSLQRVSIGPVKLGKMLPGEYRPLTSAEVDALYNAIPKRD